MKLTTLLLCVYKFCSPTSLFKYIYICFADARNTSIVLYIYIYILSKTMPVAAEKVLNIQFLGGEQ